MGRGKGPFGVGVRGGESTVGQLWPLHFINQKDFNHTKWYDAFSTSNTLKSDENQKRISRFGYNAGGGQTTNQIHVDEANVVQDMP